MAAGIAAHESQLDADPATKPWWRRLNDVRQDAMVELSYNMGERTLDDFHGTLDALRNGEFATAANHLLASEWAAEVHPTRANFVANMIRTGERPR
jgi:GH24 family phage-related lysozyme (muramidase)